MVCGIALKLGAISVLKNNKKICFIPRNLYCYFCSVISNRAVTVVVIHNNKILCQYVMQQLYTMSWINPSWWTHQAISHSASAPQLVQQRLCYMLSCLWDATYKRSPTANCKE